MPLDLTLELFLSCFVAGAVGGFTYRLVFPKYN